VSHSEELEIQTYTVLEASRILGLSRDATYKLVARGEIPAVRFGERMLRVTKATVDRLLAPDKS